jgi:hypothetical protein
LDLTDTVEGNTEQHQQQTSTRKVKARVCLKTKTLQKRRNNRSNCFLLLMDFHWEYHPIVVKVKRSTEENYKVLYTETSFFFGYDSLTEALSTEQSINTGLISL